jgi:hypothetical protein
MTALPEPIIAPSVNNPTRHFAGLPEHSCPPWGRLTSPECTGRSHSSESNHKQIDPEIEAARLAKLKLKEAKRLEAARITAEKRAAEKALRAEQSELRKARRSAAKLTAEERRAVRIAAQLKGQETMKAKRAAMPPRPKRTKPRSENRIAPAGYITMRQATKAAHCGQNSIAKWIKQGVIKPIIKGHFTYVRLDDVRAYHAGSGERRRKAQLEGIRKAMKLAPKLPEKPFPRLIKRKASA